MSAEDRLAYWKRRCAIAEHQVEWAREDAESLRRWMSDQFTEERRLRDRLTFVYSVALLHGVTREALAGPNANPEGLPEIDGPALTALLAKATP